MEIMSNSTILASESLPTKEWMEQQWAGLYVDRNPMLVTTILSFTLHELFFFLKFLPYVVIDQIPAFRKYKIQQSKQNTYQEVIKCLGHVMVSQFCIQLPMQIFFHPTADIFGMRIVEGAFPSWQELITQVFIFMLFEDFWQYWFHRLLHQPYFYKRIHKLHHEYTAPFGIAAEYAHPLETLILGMGTIGGPLLYVFFTANLHIVTVFAWLMVREFQTIDAHSGYDFPWSLHNWVPFWGGADFHDHHHMTFLGNYGSFFTFWDWVTGTDWRFVKYKKRMAALGKVKSSSAIQEVAVKEE